MFDWYEIKEHLRFKLTMFLISSIKRINPSRDSDLSYKLHQVADTYARRPTGEWKR